MTPLLWASHTSTVLNCKSHHSLHQCQQFSTDNPDRRTDTTKEADMKIPANRRSLRLLKACGCQIIPFCFFLFSLYPFSRFFTVFSMFFIAFHCFSPLFTVFHSFSPLFTILHLLLQFFLPIFTVFHCVHSFSLFSPFFKKKNSFIVFQRFYSF